MTDNRRVHTASWGLGEVVLAFLIGVVASTLVGSIILAATGDEKLDQVPMTLYSLVQASQWIGLVAVPVLVIALKGLNPWRALDAKMTRRDVPVGLALGVALQLIMVPLVSLPWVKILGRDTSELDDRARDITDRATGVGLLALSIVLIVGAPLAEELFFRSFTLKALSRRIGDLGALVVSSVLFGAIHFDVLSFPALTVFGAVMAWLVQRFGRLGPAWWAHVGFNATTVAILVIGR